MEETFPNPNIECVYLSQGNLIYLGDGKISITELPYADSGYILHPFLQDRALVQKRDLTNAYIFYLSDGFLTPIFAEEDNNNRILATQPGLIYTWNLTEDRGYLHDYRGEEGVTTEVKYPLGYEGKYTNVILPTGGEGEVLYIDNLNHTLHYKGKDLEMPSYERFDDVYFQWRPPYFLVGTEYIVFQYKLDPLREEDGKLEDYALPPLEAPGYVSGGSSGGFKVAGEGGDDTYMPTITKEGIKMVKAPEIMDGNDPDRYPELTPAMETFLWSLDAEPIVYTYRKLREMVRNYPKLLPSAAKLISKYV